MRSLKLIFITLWTLPQTLLGSILIYLFEAWWIKDYKYSDVFLSDRMKGCISLGIYIILQSGNYTEKDIRHEYGHFLQSLILGPLYLIVIGLPSLLWAWFIHDLSGKDYYWFYTERWADKLGKVNRKMNNPKSK